MHLWSFSVEGAHYYDTVEALDKARLEYSRDLPTLPNDDELAQQYAAIQAVTQVLDKYTLVAGDPLHIQLSGRWTTGGPSELHISIRCTDPYPTHYPAGLFPEVSAAVNEDC